MGLCYDIEGNSVDCGGSDAVGYSAGVSTSDTGAGLNFTSNNPIVASASSSNGPSALSGAFTSLLNFAPTAIKSFTATSPAASGLRLQVNPSTGKTQYFNPVTGQYLAGEVNTSGSLFGSTNSSFLLVLLAIVAGFFFFGRKQATA
jgi:hypothetical protein